LQHAGLPFNGLLFVTRTGRAGVPLSPPFLNPVPMNSVYRAWAAADLAKQRIDAALRA
jgi:hypothetical protein